MSKFYLIFALLCAITSSGFAANNVYKWTDSQGVVHYGSQPASENAQKVEIAPAPQPNQTQQQRREQLLERQTDREQNEALDAQKQKEIEEAKAYQKQVNTACEQYRKNLSTLQETGRRVYTVDAEGEYHYFSDEERQQEIDELQRKIQRYCVDTP